MVASVKGRCFLISLLVKPGHDIKLLALSALNQVDGTGEKQAACRYRIRSCAGCCFLIITCNFCSAKWWDITGGGWRCSITFSLCATCNFCFAKWWDIIGGGWSW